MDDPEIQAAVATLDKLAADHRWAGPLHAEVERLGVHYLKTRELSATEVESYRTSSARLVSMYKQHIRVEDERWNGCLVADREDTIAAEDERSAAVTRRVANDLTLRSQQRIFGRQVRF